MARKIGIRLILVLIACVASALTWHKFMYPFGHRSYTLRHMYAELETYAADHFGKFPDSEEGPYAALQKLYPEYSSAGELAGVSGRISDVKSALLQGAPLSQSLSSWVYVPGLEQTDAGNVAMLWESKAGFYANGRRNFFGGHAVLLVDGRVTNVSAVAWSGFLSQQEQLRKFVLSQHSSIATNVPSLVPKPSP